MGVPQLLQNFAPGSRGLPQFEQNLGVWVASVLSAVGVCAGGEHCIHLPVSLL